MWGLGQTQTSRGRTAFDGPSFMTPAPNPRLFPMLLVPPHPTVQPKHLDVRPIARAGYVAVMVACFIAATYLFNQIVP